MATTSISTATDLAGLSDLLGIITDPVERLLLTGQARTVHQAEEMYLDGAYPQVLALLTGPLSDEELGRHPLLVLYRAGLTPSSRAGRSRPSAVHRLAQG